MQATAVPPQPGEAPFVVLTSPCGTTTTVSVSGELDLATVRHLEAALHQAFVAPPETLVLDLGDATFVDSTGVQAVLRLDRRAQATGVRLVIVPAPAPIQRVFELCGIDGRLPFVR